MCGIAGLVERRRADQLRPELARLVALLAHRGPDDQGIFVADAAGMGAVGLAATRLAVQDTSTAGHQPMTSARTGSALCLNGEIYNVAELRAELAGRGHAFAGTCDTEVVLAAYDEWGADCVEHLDGMFAFATWDAPAGRLVLARDRLGIKPLYYTVADGSIAFASELRALLAGGRTRGQPSPEGVASYLATGAVQEPWSLVRDVGALPPGHVGIWDGRRLDVRRYWSLRAAFAAGGRSDGDDPRAAVRERLHAAVVSHLVSDVPLGVFLSGGIDSSALVALVADLTGTPPQTVSLVFPQEAYSEAPYIDAVRRRFGTEHTALEVTPDDIVAALPAALDAMDQPTVDGVNSYVVSGLARRSGLTVALSGVGSDELFAGYDSFRRVPRLERARALLPAPAGAVAGVLARRAGSGSDAGDKLARWLARRDAPATAYELARELFSPAARDALMAGQAPVLTSSSEAGDLPTDPVNAVSCRELELYACNQLLRDTDVMSMAHGLEVRVPFLDHHLVEAVAALPGALKRPGRTPKPLLVDALDGLLPDAVVRRRKMGFTLPFDVWMRGPLRAEVEATLSDPGCGGRVARLLDGGAVDAVWRRFADGGGHWSRPWSVYVLKRWGEAHLAG